MLECLEAYREDRVAKITACETPVPLTDGSKLVLQLIPIASLETPTSVDVSTIEPAHEDLFLLGCTDRAQSRINFDGITVAHFPDEGTTTGAYLQVARTGRLESVYPLSFMDHPNGDAMKMIPSLSVETRLIDSMIPYLRLISFLELVFPVASMISLTGVQGCGVLPNTLNRHFSHFRRSIDQDVLLLPPIEFASVPETDDEVVTALKPAFDVMWQAAGWEGSYNYRGSGYKRE